MLKKGRWVLLALCIGHLVNDAYSSIIYPLLPLLKDKLFLSDAQVFWIAPLYAISSSILQPLYGYISDRKFRKFFAVSGPALTATFVSLIGLAPSYAALVFLLICGGIGIGAFHPQGAAMATAASGDRRRIGMAIFSASGTIGFALGPVIIALVVNAFGLESTWYVIGVGFVMSAVLYKVCPPLEPYKHSTTEGHSSAQSFLSPLLAVWKPLFILYVITVIRSGMQITTNYYVPFLLDERGYEVRATGMVLTVFLLLGGLGGLAGGFLAERMSGRIVTIYSGVLAGPLMIGAFMTEGITSIVLLGLGGFMLLSTLPVLVAMAQELAPNQTSTVSALMMGAAWGIGALAPSFLRGAVSAHGYRTVLIFASGATMITAVLAAMLPREKRVAARAASPIAEGATGD